MRGAMAQADPSIQQRLLEDQRMAITHGIVCATTPLTRLTEPVGDLTAGRLDLRLDGAHLELRSADLDDVLFDYAGHRPWLTVDRPSGYVRARHSRSWLCGPPPPDVDVLLNGRLPWMLRAGGAGLCGRLDLRHLRLDGLELSARGGRFRADLPAPVGSVLVRLGGRGALASLSVPEGTCVRFWQEHGWLVEGHRSEGPVASDRYDVWLDGGAGRCSVATRRANPGDTARLHVIR
jgi:hypothetical protein